MKSFVGELRRRNVIRVAVAYGVTAWILVEIASVLLPTLLVPDWVLRAFTALIILGFPLALIFAWAFELTSEGLKREKDVDRSQSVTHHTGRKLDFMIIGLLVLALGVSVTLHFTGDKTIVETARLDARDDGLKTIAVLPFVNMSADPENEYFSDGIAEELLNVLVRVEGLRVSSRTSSFAFKDREASVPEIAEHLNVDHILEGSVRKAGTTVRITAQLIDVKSDTHLWSDTYDRELEDIFAIQEEIAGNIVQALKIALGAGDAAERISAQPTDNLEAYQLYLQGRHLWQLRGGERLIKSIELLEQAIKLDPEFARAHSTLAAAYGVFPGYVPEALSAKYNPLAKANAQRAIDLDSNIAEPHAVLGLVYQTELDWLRSEAEFRQAIELEPGEPTTRFWLGLTYLATGRLREALASIEHALELNPVSDLIMGWESYAHLLLEQDVEAWTLAQRATTMGNLAGSWGSRGQLEFRRGEFVAAAESFRRGYAGSGRDLSLMDPFFEWVKTQQNADKALEALDAARAKDRTLWLPWEYRYLGALNRAFDAVDAAVEADNGTWINVVWEPESKAMRQHPRFKPMIEKYGIVDYWRATTWGDLCRPLGNDDFECD